MNERRRATDSLTHKLFMSVFLMALLYLVYERVAPVVTGFEIAHTIQTDDSVKLYGTFNKLRDCRFNSLFVTSTINGIEYPLIFEFTDVANAPAENRSTRQSAHQYFGPWTVHLIEGADNLNIRSIHACDFGIYRSSTLIKGFAL